MILPNYEDASVFAISYNFTSALLTNRLKKILPKLTSSSQSAFVPSRDIHDNILITHEILSTFSKNLPKGRYLAITTPSLKALLTSYMVKAYDRLEWNFI